MSLRTYLQDHPTPLVWMWRATEAVLKSMKPLFERVGVDRSSAIVQPVEEMGKHLIFNCQACGQCLLHYTGMTCPMNCPKNLRNGPCGGVRLNGHCEVKPEMDCVWVKGYERIQKTPYASEFYRLNPPVDWRLEKTSSFVNMSVGRDQVPTGIETTIRYAIEAVAKHGTQSKQAAPVSGEAK
jgi:hypothetical protein